MNWEAWFTLTLTSTVIITLIKTKLPPHIVMMSAVMLLSTTNILPPNEALSGFSNPGVITIAAMFIIAAGIKHSGGVNVITKHILRHPKSERSAIVRLLIPTALLSAFLNNTPIVATLIPAVHSWAKKINIPVSKLMIPLSYSAILGGTLTLIGTSTNLAVNGQYQLITGDPALGIFAITKISLPVSIIAGIFIIIFFPKWLPNRQKNNQLDSLREFTCEVSVDINGPIVNKTVSSAGLRNLRRVYLVEIERKESIITPVAPNEILYGGDRLVFAGDTDAISELLNIHGIIPSPSTENTTYTRAFSNRKLIQVVVSTHCRSIGSALRDTKFRERYSAAVLAIAREGERVKGNLGTIKLQAGDTLLLEAPPSFIEQQKYNKDFLLLNELDQEVPRHEKAYIAWGILLSLLICTTTGLTSILNASLIGAAAMLLFKCCSIQQAEKSLDLSVLITIAASLSLGIALEKTGVASTLAEHIIALSDGKFWVSLVLIYISVSLLTELITNNASAILILPIALNIAEEMAFPNEPYLIAIMIAASASFSTPLGYQTNLMVYGPGGYHFKDFLKVGIPLNLLVGFCTLSLILFIW